MIWRTANRVPARRGTSLGVALVLLAGCAVAAARAQPQSGSSTPPADAAALAPIECWWKTDRSAIRVGELFQLTLTCGVIDTDTLDVVVDESSLAPSALHLVPFDVVGGRRFRDIRNSPRRFFQYAYTMRILGEDFFGKDVSLPRLQLTYRIQRAGDAGAALAGREQQYSLRPVPLRVLSLVPPGANDIRDAPPETFGDVDARMFRSYIFFIAAAVALVIAVLTLLVALVRSVARRRRGAPLGERVVSPSVVLRAAARELGSVDAAARDGSWNGDLAGRAAAAVRLAGAVALGATVSQRPAVKGSTPGEGQVGIARGLRRSRLWVSAAVTPRRVPGDTSDDALWQGLRQALETFTEARYSRSGTVDGPALDSALAAARDIVARLRRRHVLRMPRRARAIREMARPTWAR